MYTPPDRKTSIFSGLHPRRFSPPPAPFPAGRPERRRRAVLPLIGPRLFVARKGDAKCPSIHNVRVFIGSVLVEYGQGDAPFGLYNHMRQSFCRPVLKRTRFCNKAALLFAEILRGWTTHPAEPHILWDGVVCDIHSA